MLADPPDIAAALEATPGLDAATIRAVMRSMRIYHGDAQRDARMDQLYGKFIRPGDLAFDIGAHVGDRVASFRRLGARVVAFEPQPGPARAIELLYGGDDRVTLVRAAVSDREGMLRLKVNTHNPTVSTASAGFIAAADAAAGWEGQIWDAEIEVPATTLERLIEIHGIPAFAKIDVEGFEDRVLAGLIMPLPALSFEFTTIARDVARHCLERLTSLGSYRCNLSLGETQQLQFPQWVTTADMSDHLMRLPDEANSGDVYAVLKAPPT